MPRRQFRGYPSTSAPRQARGMLKIRLIVRMTSAWSVYAASRAAWQEVFAVAVSPSQRCKNALSHRYRGCPSTIDFNDTVYMLQAWP